MMIVVVPAYNEEKTIGRVIRDLFQHGINNVVVVDDGSDDHTSKIAKENGAKVVRHMINRGQGAALETGNRYALSKGAEIVVHFDADGQFNAADILKAEKFMKENRLQAVLGSRFLDNRSNIPFFKKYFLLPAGRWINFLFTGSLLTDAHNGFRIMDSSVLKILRITQDRMAHNTEILRQLKVNGIKYAEYPIEVRYNEYGQGAAGGIKILQDLIIGLFS